MTRQNPSVNRILASGDFSDSVKACKVGSCGSWRSSVRTKYFGFRVIIKKENTYEKER